jgi:flavin-dependent dehydrogenase
VTETFDLTVIGAGPSGSTLAIALARHGLNVMLVDKGDLRCFKVGEFLPGKTRHTINRHRLMPVDWSTAHTEVYEFLNAWTQPTPIVRDFIYDPFGLPLALDRSFFERQLVEAASYAGVTVKLSTRISVEKRSSTWNIALKNKFGTSFAKTHFLVFCGGRNSSNRFDSQRSLTDKMAFIGFRSPCEEEHGPPSLEAIESGWVYSTVIKPNELIVYLVTDGDLLFGNEISRKHNFVSFLNRIESTTIAASRSEKITCNGNSVSLFGGALTSFISTKINGSGWCLAGDEAKCFDPLSSMGLSESIDNSLWLAHLISTSKTFPNLNLKNYQDKTLEIYKEYETNRLLIYSQEKRWPNSFFWKRRQTTEALTAIK